MTQNIEWAFMVLLVLAQAPLPSPDWTQMVSPYFAFAAAAFLIWSLVQLVNLIYKHSTAATDATITTLRERIHNLENMVTERLFATAKESAEALKLSSDTLKGINTSLVGLANEMHLFDETLKRVETSLTDHDRRVAEYVAQAAGIDPKTLERVQRRQERVERHNNG